MKNSIRTAVLMFISVVPGTTYASTITQVSSGHFAEHGTNFSGYKEFNPALGTLTSVTLDFTNGQATSNRFIFQNFTEFPVTSTNIIVDFIDYGGIRLDLTGTFVDVILPGKAVTHSTTRSFNGTTVLTTGLSRFIGVDPNPLLPPDITFDFSNMATATAIGVIPTRETSSVVDFTETITYTYLAPGELASVPEPASLVSLALGLIGIIFSTVFRRCWA